jgi:hypothetical protein
MRTRSLPAATAAFIALVAARPAATVLAPADLAEIAAAAVAIVHGRVTAVVSDWRDDRRGIETTVIVRASDYLKGNLGPQVSFRVPGGQIGPYRSIMPGAPAFLEGEEVVVFLSAAGGSGSHMVGFSQGVYRVRTDSAGRQVLRGGPLLAGSSAERASGRGSRPATLTDLAARLQTIVAEGRPR